MVTRLSDWIGENPELGMSCSPGCVLTDRDWNQLAQQDVLVRRFRAEERTGISVQEACLEVHLAETVKLTATGEEKVIPEGEDVFICPGEVVLITTQEHFTVPHDVQGQMSPKGKLLTIGLSAPTTQVDPGFTGPLFLAIANPGPRPVKLPGGYAVAKVEMQVLCAPVDRPWIGKNPAYSYFARELIAPPDTPCDTPAYLRSSVEEIKAEVRESFPTVEELSTEVMQTLPSEDDRKAEIQALLPAPIPPLSNPELARRIRNLQRWLLVLTAVMLCVPLGYGLVQGIRALDPGRAGLGQSVLSEVVGGVILLAIAGFLTRLSRIRDLWGGPTKA